MQKIKAVFFDFDWTLFDHKTRSFIPSAIAAINEAHASGVKTFIDSARSYYALRELGTFKKVPFDGFVVNNGGAAFTMDNVLYAKYFTEETIKEIVSRAREHGLSYLLVTLKEAYICHRDGDSNVDHFYSVFYEPRPRPMEEYKGEPVLAAQVFMTNGLDHVFNAIPHTVFNRFSDVAIDLTREPFHKDEGIKALIADTGFSKDELAAFGDDYNDIDMFNLVGHGICMGNGSRRRSSKTESKTASSTSASSKSKTVKEKARLFVICTQFPGQVDRIIS